MAFDAGAIVAELKLDSKGFDKGMDDAEKKTGSLNKGLLGLAAAATAVSAALIGIAKSSADYADKTIKAARAAGMTAEEFSKLNHAADLSGISTESLTSSMGFLNRSLSKSGDEADKTGKTFAKFGITTKRMDGSIKSANELVGEISEAYKNLEDPVQRAELATTAFGRSGMQMASMLELGEEGLKQMADEAERLGIVVSTKAGQSAELFNDNIRRLEQSFRGLTQSIGSAIIEFVNTSGIMEALTSAVVAMRQMWDNMNDTVKEFLLVLPMIMAGALIAVSAFAVIKMAAMGLFAVLMANPVILAITALTAVAVIMAKEIIKYWDQIAPVIQPLAGTFRQLGTSIKNAFAPIAEMASRAIAAARSILGIGDNADSSTGKIAILATIGKVAMGTIAIAIEIVIRSFKILVNSINIAITSLTTLLTAFSQLNSGNIMGAATTLRTGVDSIRQSITNVSNEAAALGRNVSTTFREMTNPVREAKGAVGDVKKSIADLNKETDKVGGKAKENFDEAANAITSMGSKIGDAVHGIGKITGAFGELPEIAQQGMAAASGIAEAAIENMFQKMSNQLENIKRKAEIFDLFSQVQSRKMQERQEAELKDAEDRMRRETEAFKKNEQEKLDAVESSHRLRIEMLKQAQIEEQALRDEELQAELARLEQEKQMFLEEQRFLFEQRQLELLDKAETQAQERLIKETNEQDWLAFVDRTNSEFLQKQFDATQEHRQMEKERNEEFKVEITSSDAEMKAQMEAEQVASNERMKAHEEEQAAKLQAIKDKQEDEKRAADKKTAGIRYMLEIMALEMQKKIQMAQATIQLASGLMGAASAAAAMGPFGIPFFAAMAGLLKSTYSMSRASIMSQVVLPPPELLMESGGLIGGRRHANGGTRMGSIEAERGELFIDRARTDRLFESMDSGMGTNITFESGSIIVNGSMDDDMVDTLAEQIGRRIERRAF
jgi:hypothetical protein